MPRPHARSEAQSLRERLAELEIAEPVEASIAAEDLLSDHRAKGFDPPAESVARALEIHRAAYEVEGPSSPQGGDAVARWLALGGDPIRPAVAALAEAWREGRLDESLVPGGLPPEASAVLRLACRLLGTPAEDLPRPIVLANGIRKILEGRASSVPELFRLWLAARRGDGATLGASLRERIDERPVAAVLAFLASGKKRLLARHELPPEYSTLSREKFLLAAAQEELEGAGGEASWEALAASPLAHQYPSSIFPWDPEALLGRVPLDALPRKVAAVSEIDFGEDGDRRYLGRLLERTREALARGRLDVVHSVLPLAIERAPGDSPIAADLEHVHRATGFLLGCPECSQAARLDLFARLAEEAPDPDSRLRADLLALCREVVSRPEAWPAGIRVRALTILAEAGEAIDAKAVADALRRAPGGFADDAAGRLLAALDPREAWWARVWRALERGERDVFLAVLGEIPPGPQGTPVLAEALRQALEREAVARRYRGHERVLAEGGVRPLPPLGLDGENLRPFLERCAADRDSLELASILSLLGALRRVHGLGELQSRVRDALRPRVAALLERPASRDETEPPRRLAAGILCRDERAVTEAVRDLRSHVAGAGDWITRSRTVWRFLVDLEGARSAFPAEAPRIESWQRALLAAIRDFPDETFWSPALEPREDLSYLESLGRFLLRMQFHLPSGPEPAIILARHHLLADLDLVKATRWIREARKRLRYTWGASPLHGVLKEVQSMAEGLSQLVERGDPPPRSRSRRR